MTKGYEYATAVVNGGSEYGKYVKIQCQRFLDIVDGRVEDAYFSEAKYERLCKLLKIMNQSVGSAAGVSFYDSLVGFQWLILEAVFCLVNGKGLRFIQNLTLEISRKNGKSLIAGLILLIALLTEKRFTKLYSISVNSQLAREAYTAMKQILLSSPLLYDETIQNKGRTHQGNFYITNDNIRCNITDNDYTPLSNNPKALDGKLISLGICDEVGALPTNQPMEAMRASQITLDEKLTIVISTKYPGLDNPMESECAYSKRILDGTVDDIHYFSLLYEPDNDIIEEWQTNDDVLKQSNPLALEIPTIWEALLKQRQKAILDPNSKGYFLNKNANIQAALSSLEEYVKIEDLKACQVEPGSINWEGRDVFVGIDLSLTSDNTSYSMVAQEDSGDVICKPECFIPAERVEEKSRFERVEYQRYINANWCQACGDTIIDYKYIEDKILAIEDTYHVNVLGVYADPWHCTATAQRLMQEGGMPVVLVKQVSYVLGKPTLTIRELVEQHRFKFERNDLFLINFQNAKAMYDSNLNLWINKKRSAGKIDMVAATINAMYGLCQSNLLDSDFGAYCM